jgi:hypothetical protein
VETHVEMPDGDLRALDDRTGRAGWRRHHRLRRTGARSHAVSARSVRPDLRPPALTQRQSGSPPSRSPGRRPSDQPPAATSTGRPRPWFRIPFHRRRVRAPQLPRWPRAGSDPARDLGTAAFAVVGRLRARKRGQPHRRPSAPVDHLRSSVGRFITFSEHPAQKSCVKRADPALNFGYFSRVVLGA